MTTLRPARTDEAAALSALQLRASLAVGDHVEELLADPAAASVPADHIAHTTVLEREGVVQGFVTLLPLPDGRAEVEGLFVEPEAWRSGYGRALLTEALAQARAEGRREVTVIANPRAVAFYEALGFAVTGTADTAWAPAPVMNLRLS